MVMVTISNRVMTSGCATFLVLAVAGCGNGGGSDSSLLLPASMDGYCAPSSAEHVESADCVACCSKNSNVILIQDEESALSNSEPNIVQQFTTASLVPAGLAANEDPHPLGPVLYVFGYRPSTGLSELWGYGPGVPGEAPIASEPHTTFVFPRGEMAVSVFQPENKFLWAATANDAGKVSVYRLIDTSGDGAPDQARLFARLETLRATHPATVAKLAVAPFDLRHESRREVVFVQEGSSLFRVFDRDGNGTAEEAILPDARYGSGTIVSRGAKPGAVLVELQGPPSEPVELWSLDDSDAPLAKVAFGTSDLDGRTVLSLGAALSGGERFAVRHPESDFYGPVAIVEPSPAPTAIRLTPSAVLPGGSIDVYVPAASLAAIAATWKGIDEAAFGTPRSEPCAVTALGDDRYRVTFPDGVAPFFPRFQTLEINVAGLEVPEHLDVLVAPPSDDDADGGG